MAKTLFERCGGFSTVRKIVSAFYDKVLDNDRLQHYFADVDMRRLIDHQTQFISAIMGGPSSLTDDVVRRVHARLGISSSEYREMASIIRETFEDFDFEPDEVGYVYNEVMRRQSLIVTRYD